ncbi:MAG: hypothetical protein ACK59Y_07415 [Betaproteobacteria bacterium]|jgi:hypothetical protein|nr:hypothetical protein [Betaproteobacteria bacterium]
MNIDDINGLPCPEDIAERVSAEHALVVAELRGALARCENGGIDKATVNAVLIAELLPRLVDAYGPLGVAGVLGQLAAHVAQSHPGATLTRQ